MLKIAEYNTITGKKIKLEELEKFGFKLIEKCSIPVGCFEVHIVDCYVKPNSFGEYDNSATFIETNLTKQILVPSYDLDTIYDLIEAGLVEKVSDGE